MLRPFLGLLPFSTELSFGQRARVSTVRRGERKAREKSTRPKKKERERDLRQTAVTPTLFSPSHASLFSRSHAKFAAVLHISSLLSCLIIYSPITQLCICMREYASYTYTYPQRKTSFKYA